MIDISNIFKEVYKTKSPELGIILEIKSKILNYNKSEEGIKNPINDEIEIRILKNLKKEHEETLSFLKSDSKEADDERVAISFLDKYLPAEASVEEVTAEAQKIVVKGNKKEMGNYIKILKSTFPATNGKLIADVVKSLLG